MDYKNLTSPCGLDCWNCIVYLSKDNKSIRKMVSEKLNLPEEKVSCPGCRNSNGMIDFLDMKEPCKIYKCITRKQIDLCSECNDFPCGNLQPYAQFADKRPQNIKVFNLCLIKNMGLEEWAKTKAKSVRDNYFYGKMEL